MGNYTAYKFGYRCGFVSLRYIAAAFFFLSQVATYITVEHYLNVANNLLTDVTQENLDIIAIYLHASEFRIEGDWGVFLQMVRSLGNLVIPLYFVATVSFVLNLNRRATVDITLRNALLAIVFYAIELVVLLAAAMLAALLTMGLCEVLSQHFPNLTEALNEILKYLDIGIYGMTLSDASSVSEAATSVVMSYLLARFPSFNTFLDLFLCLTLCTFLVYRPKWVDSERKLIFYRSLAIFPAIYIVGAFLLNGLSRNGVLYLDYTVLMMMPARRPLFYAFFACILVCHRMQSKPPMRVWEGLSPIPEGKKPVFGNPAVLETRAAAKKRALGASVFLSVCLLLLCAVDFIFSYMPYGAGWGLGKSYFAVFCIPFLFFFDDRKPVTKRSYTVFMIVYMVLILIIVILYGPRYTY